MKKLMALCLFICTVNLFYAEEVYSQEENKTVPIIYEKDGCLCVADAMNTDKKSVIIHGSYEEMETDIILCKPNITPDGKYLCFLCRSEEEEYGKTLFMKEVDEEAAPVELDTGVHKYRLLDDGRVIYERSGELISNDLKGNKVIIDKNVNWDLWSVTEDQKRIIWMHGFTEDTRQGGEGLYCCKTDTLKPMTISSAAVGAYHLISNEEKVFYYEDDGYLYVSTDFVNTVKVSQNVEDMFVDDNGDVYYTKDVEGKCVYDYIKDDVLRTEMDYPLSNTVNDCYDRKKQADAVRNVLKSKRFTDWVLRQICIFTEGEERVLESSALCNEGVFCDCARVMFFSPGAGYYSFDNSEPIYLSEICSDPGIRRSKVSKIDVYRVGSAFFELVRKKNPYKYCCKEGNISLSEKMEYAFCNENADIGYGVKLRDDGADLYTFDLSGESAGICKVYAENINSSVPEDELFFIQNKKGDIYYYADYGEDRHANLYKNKEIICKDIPPTEPAYKSDFPDSALRIEYQDDILYFPLKKENQTYDYAITLCKYDGTKITEIGKKVNSYIVYDSDCIVLLTDFDDSKKCGTLSVYDGEKVTIVAEGVASLPKTGYDNWRQRAG